MEHYTTSYLLKWQNIRYVEVSSVVIMFYDFFLTSDMEMRYMWTTPWTGLKVLYIISRYTVFIDMLLNAWREFNFTATDSECLLYFKATVWISAIGLGACEVLLTVRLCAVYGMKRRIISTTAGFFIALYTSELFLIYHWLKQIEATAMHEYPHLTGCILYTESKLFHTVWILLLVYDSGLFFMISLKGHSFLFRPSTLGMRLSTAVYRDGMLYYLYLFAISLLNVMLLDKVTYLGPISSVQRVLHSILTSRLILGIRRTANTDDSFWGTTRGVVSRVDFRRSGDSLGDEIMLTTFRASRADLERGRRYDEELEDDRVL